MNYFIKTFGCQQNKSDSERIEGDYQSRGYKLAKSWKNADEIIVNTCSVRQRAEDRVLGYLNNVVKHFSVLNKKKPKIILTGCMTHHSNKRIYEMLPMVDQILPVNEVGFNKNAVRKDKEHAWVPISTGCNSFCTFCIVPYARGREKSRSEEEIISEIKKLVENGYKEITLLGMNVNSWGLEKVGVGFRKLLMDRENNFRRADLPSNQSQYLKPKGLPPFVSLLRKISLIKKVELIRFMTSNPWDFYDELIDEIAMNKKIDRYIHIPVQSGSNRILKLMNRGYTKEDYIKLITKLRERIAGVAIGTDIIVGFPGETKIDFQETVDLANIIDWKVAFVAQYSPRPGTGAWRIYKDDITAKEKKRRWKILEDIINKPNLNKRPVVIK